MKYKYKDLTKDQEKLLDKNTIIPCGVQLLKGTRAYYKYFNCTGCKMFAKNSCWGVNIMYNRIEKHMSKQYHKDNMEQYMSYLREQIDKLKIEKERVQYEIMLEECIYAKSQ